MKAELSLLVRQVVLLPFPFSDLSNLFTAHASMIRSVAGALNDAAHQRVLDAVASLLRSGSARE